MFQCSQLGRFPQLPGFLSLEWFLLYFKCSTFDSTDNVLPYMNPSIPHFSKRGELQSLKWFTHEYDRVLCLKRSTFCHWRHSNSHLAPPLRTGFEKVFCNLGEAPKSAKSKAYSSAITNGTCWSLAKAVYRNFYSSSFPPICNSSGGLVSESHGEADACVSRMFPIPL